MLGSCISSGELTKFIQKRLKSSLLGSAAKATRRDFCDANRSSMERRFSRRKESRHRVYGTPLGTVAGVPQASHLSPGLRSSHALLPPAAPGDGIQEDALSGEVALLLSRPNTGASVSVSRLSSLGSSGCFDVCF